MSGMKLVCGNEDARLTFGAVSLHLLKSETLSDSSG
jgi:hypothetical protein